MTRYGRTDPKANKGDSYIVTTGLPPVKLATVRVAAYAEADTLIRRANAAPALLAACKAVLARFEGDRGYTPETQQLLRAAIAKAKGQKATK